MNYKQMRDEALDAQNDALFVACSIAIEGVDMTPEVFEERFGGGGYRLTGRELRRFSHLSAAAAAAECLIIHAMGQWSGWDWSHDPAGEVVDGPGAVADWDGWQAERAAELARRLEAADARRMARRERTYGESCQRAAERFAGELEEALDALRDGDLSKALECARGAYHTEAEYGDAPLAREVIEALEALEVPS